MLSVCGYVLQHSHASPNPQACIKGVRYGVCNLLVLWVFECVPLLAELFSHVWHSVHPGRLQGERRLLVVRGLGAPNTAGAPSRRKVLHPKEECTAPHLLKAAPWRGEVHRGNEDRLNVMGRIIVGAPEATAEAQSQRRRAQMVGTEAPRTMAVAPAQGTTGALSKMIITTRFLLEEVGLRLEASNEYCLLWN